MRNLVCCVIPNWNGVDEIGDALASLKTQTREHLVIVVENGSTDGSIEFIEQNYPDAVLLKQPKNLGFAGGVNVGIRYALEQDAFAVALFNNDAVADKHWLEHLVRALEEKPDVGIATCKFMDIKRQHFDSTGDLYTIWGLPYPRGRGEPVSNKYDQDNFVFAASGGASLYRAETLQNIGLFDEDFFAYYEDVDISFRAQLAGWRVYFEPRAEAYHKISATSSKIRGFPTYQTIKNLPFIYWKNAPLGLAVRMFPRLFFAYWMFFFRALLRGQFGPAIKGAAKCHFLLFKKLFVERPKIQRLRKVDNDYLSSIITQDLPPNAKALHAVRKVVRKILFKPDLA